MRGKNSKPRYETLYFHWTKHKWIPITTFTCMADVAKALDLSESTCKKILKGQHTKYENMFKIRKL